MKVIEEGYYWIQCDNEGVWEIGSKENGWWSFIGTQISVDENCIYKIGKKIEMD